MKENRLPYRKDSGFKVPEGYFGEFEDRMMTRLTLTEGKFEENPFKVPENYFKELSGRLMENVNTAPEKGKIIPLFNRRMLSYVASIAAIFAILLSSVIFKSTGELSFEDLNVVAIENYLLESLDLENTNIAPAEDYNFTASANPNIDKEALLEYLNDHIEEPALLLNDD